jgi:hypothetical protein
MIVVVVVIVVDSSAFQAFSTTTTIRRTGIPLSDLNPLSPLQISPTRMQAAKRSGSFSSNFGRAPLQASMA